MLGAPLNIKQKLTDLYRRRAEACRRIEASGGIDYKHEMNYFQKEIDKLTGATIVPSTRIDQARWDEVKRNIQLGVSTNSSARVAEAIIESLLYHDISDDDGDPMQDIASDFIENELGRFDWVENWKLVKQDGSAVDRIEAYLSAYGIDVDPQEVAGYIDRMEDKNPGRWH
jgi:hypothetical protein